MLLAMTLIPAGDTAGKLLGEAGVAPVFTAWSRFTLGAVMILPFVARIMPLALFADWRIWLRGLLLAGGILSILTALRTEPIADVFGAFFIGPILAYVLSAWLLREGFSPLRIILLLLGFCGDLLVVRPGFGSLSASAIFHHYDSKNLRSDHRDRLLHHGVSIRRSSRTSA